MTENYKNDKTAITAFSLLTSFHLFDRRSSEYLTNEKTPKSHLVDNWLDKDQNSAENSNEEMLLPVEPFERNTNSPEDQQYAKLFQNMKEYFSPLWGYRIFTIHLPLKI